MQTVQDPIISYLPLITAFSSGVFSLIVTLTTILITNKLSKSTDFRKIKQEKGQRILDLFTELIYQIAGLIQEVDFTEEKLDKTRIDKIHLSMAKLKLLSDKNLVKNIENTLVCYNEYIDIHYKNKPKKTGNLTIVSSTNKPDFEKENVKWKELSNNMEILTDKLKEYLEKKGII